MAKKKRITLEEARLEMREKLEQTFPDKPSIVEIKIFNENKQKYDIKKVDLKRLMDASPTEQVQFFALREKAMILEARRKFWDFCLYFDPEFFNKRKIYTKLVCDEMQNTYNGKYDTISLSMPVRSGKSYITSLFCVWLLGNHPSESIIRASFSLELSVTFSKDCRAFIESPKFIKVFPAPECRLSKDSRAKDAWALVGARQLSYIIASPSSSLTGKEGSLCMVIDDILKGYAEGMNQKLNEDNLTWFWSVFNARKSPNRRVPTVILNTRWSSIELIQSLINIDYFDKIISIPALNDKGESFCPNVWATEDFIKIRDDMEKTGNGFVFDAVYLQKPQDQKGLLYPARSLNYFNISEIKDKKPDAIVAYADIADAGKDHTSMPIGYVYGREVYIVDWLFTSDSAYETIPKVAIKLKHNGVQQLTIEANNAGNLFADSLDSQLAGYPIMLNKINNTANKQTRLSLNAGYIRTFFYFRKDDSMNVEYLNAMAELNTMSRESPNQRDDSGDSCTGLYETLQQQTASIEIWN